MLKILRHKNVSKVVLWAILILVLPAFVIWGTGSLGDRSKGPKFVGLIDNKKVTFEDFYASIVAIRGQIILSYFAQPQIIETMFTNKPFLAKLAWDRLIMLRTAKSNKIKVTDEEVVKYIRTAPIFLRDGQFDERVYAYILKNNMGLAPRTFEEMVRDNLEIQGLSDNLTKDVKADAREAADLYKKDTAKFRIAYVLLSYPEYLAKAQVGDGEVRAYYDNNPDEFLVPVKGQAGGDEAMKPAEFDEVKEDLRKALGRAEAREMAQKDAALYYGRLKDAMDREGMTFAEACAAAGLAVAQSEPFGKSDYVEGLGEAMGLAEAASRLDPGGITAPVETRAGLVIASLVSVDGYDEAAFEAVKDEYARRALENRKNAFLEDWLRDLERNTTLNIDFADYEKYYR